MRAFHESIRPIGGMTLRQTVIALLVRAGYDNDRKTWGRLYVENRIAYATAELAWSKGARARRREAATA